jgi:hypothetical protein
MGDSDVVVTVEIKDAQTAKEAFGSDDVAVSVGDADATHAAGKTVVKAPKSLKHNTFLEGTKLRSHSKVDKTRAVYTCPLTFPERCLSLKMLFKAPNAAVVDLMRLQTSSSEARE